MVINAAPKQIKTMELKSADTVYHALSDGYVVAYHSTAEQFIGYIGSANPPTYALQKEYGSNGGSMSYPVKKGNYWKVTTASVIYWIPSK